MQPGEKRIIMFCPEVADEAAKKIGSILKDRWIGQGAYVDRFEAAVREKADAPFAVAVNSASAAIRLALAVIGVGPGDEVITTPQTCTATNHPILEQFAVPVFSDIQYLTGNMEPGDIERRITGKTKAIICVHIDGYPCDLDEIHAVAQRNGIAVIEDASDGLGAFYKGKRVGSISPFTVFSFGAVQPVTSGEGGMLCLLEESRYEAVKRRRWYGIDRVRRTPNITGYYDFDVTEPGYGYHMTNIAAVLGLTNMEQLFDGIVRRKSEIVARYRSELDGVPGVTLFERKADRICCNHTFTVHVENRDAFCRMMNSKGVEVSVVHVRNDLYTVFGGLRRDLPNLDRFTDTYISIPLTAQLRDEEVSYIISCVQGGW